MSKLKFETLLREFCKAVNVEEVDRLLETGHLRVDDFDIAVIHDEELDPELIFVYTDFGELPADRPKRLVYRSMLESNYFIANSHDGILAIQPDTKRAVMTARVNMSHVNSGTEFAQILSGYVDHAERWHESLKEPQVPEALHVGQFPQALWL